MFCKKCGSELKRDARFCPKCGTMVSVSSREKKSSKETKWIVPAAVVVLGIGVLAAKGKLGASHRAEESKETVKEESQQSAEETAALQESVEEIQGPDVAKELKQEYLDGYSDEKEMSDFLIYTYSQGGSEQKEAIASIGEEWQALRESSVSARADALMPVCLGKEESLYRSYGTVRQIMDLMEVDDGYTRAKEALTTRQEALSEMYTFVLPSADWIPNYEGVTFTEESLAKEKEKLSVQGRETALAELIADWEEYNAEVRTSFTDWLRAYESGYDQYLYYIKDSKGKTTEIFLCPSDSVPAVIDEEGRVSLAQDSELSSDGAVQEKEDAPEEASAELVEENVFRGKEQGDLVWVNVQQENPNGSEVQRQIVGSRLSNRYFAAGEENSASPLEHLTGQIYDYRGNLVKDFSEQEGIREILYADGRYRIVTNTGRYYVLDEKLEEIFELTDRTLKEEDFYRVGAYGMLYYEELPRGEASLSEKYVIKRLDDEGNEIVVCRCRDAEEMLRDLQPEDFVIGNEENGWYDLRKYSGSNALTADYPKTMTPVFYEQWMEERGAGETAAEKAIDPEIDADLEDPEEKE